MEQGLITCPNCGQEFELSDALTGRIREHLKVELLQEVSRREAELKKKSDVLKAQEAQISKSREAIDAEIETRLKARLAEAENRAAKKLAGQYAEQFKDLQQSLAEKDAAIRTFRDQELELRKRQRKLEEDRESFELEAARKLDAEREKIRGEAQKKVA
jgi:DNA repair exonuclease SbcCD ATPase subunit